MGLQRIIRGHQAISDLPLAGLLIANRLMQAGNQLKAHELLKIEYFTANYLGNS